MSGESRRKQFPRERQSICSTIVSRFLAVQKLILKTEVILNKKFTHHNLFRGFEVIKFDAINLWRKFYMLTDNGYYDFDIELDTALIESGMLDDLFYLQDLKQRKLFLNTDIDQVSVFDIAHHIMQYNRDDMGIDIQNRKPILLYISSNGGEIDSGFELIDIIQCSKTPVYTINLGYQYSMGLLVGLAGHKRFATPNAKFLMHDGSNFVYNSGAKAQDQMKFQSAVEERVKSYILSKTQLTSEEYDGKLRVEWYMFSDEAKEKGFTDFIIGIDCGIDEII